MSVTDSGCKEGSGDARGLSPFQVLHAPASPPPAQQTPRLQQSACTIRCPFPSSSSRLSISLSYSHHNDAQETAGMAPEYLRAWPLDARHLVNPISNEWHELARDNGGASAVSNVSGVGCCVRTQSVLSPPHQSISCATRRQCFSPFILAREPIAQLLTSKNHTAGFSLTPPPNPLTHHPQHNIPRSPLSPRRLPPHHNPHQPLPPQQNSPVPRTPPTLLPRPLLLHMLTVIPLLEHPLSRLHQDSRHSPLQPHRLALRGTWKVAHIGSRERGGREVERAVGQALG